MAAIPFRLDAPMAGSVDSQKVGARRRLMARFENSGLSVSGFCSEAGISVTSFYFWRKRLVQLARLAPGPYLGDGGGGRHLAAKAGAARRPLCLRAMHGQGLVTARRDAGERACEVEGIHEAATATAGRAGCDGPLPAGAADRGVAPYPAPVVIDRWRPRQLDLEHHERLQGGVLLAGAWVLTGGGSFFE